VPKWFQQTFDAPVPNYLKHGQGKCNLNGNTHPQSPILTKYSAHSGNVKTC
jgi:hypothetical protein